MKNNRNLIFLGFYLFGVALAATPFSFSAIAGTDLELSAGYGQMQNAANPNFQRAQISHDIDSTDAFFAGVERQSRFGLHDGNFIAGFRSVHRNELCYGGELTFSPDPELLARYSAAFTVSSAGIVHETDLSASFKISRYFNALGMMLPLGADFYQLRGFVFSAKVFPGIIQFDGTSDWKFTYGGFLRAFYDLEEKLRPAIWVGYASEPQLAFVSENAKRLSIWTLGSSLRVYISKFWIEPQIEYTYRDQSIFRTQWMGSLTAHIPLN